MPVHKDKTVKSRADKIKAYNQEQMREKISFTKTLAAIDEAEDTLSKIIKNNEDVSNGRIGALKTLLDSKWKKMDRLLPVLKAIELTGEIDSEITIKWKS